jgi:hypothetical protein
MKYYDLNGVEFKTDDDVEDQEFLDWLGEKWDEVSTFFAGEPVQPPIYSDASGQFEQVREQAPLVTEEATRPLEPYITGGMARDVIVGSEMLARNLAGQRVDTSEDIAAATAGIGVTGAGSTAFSKPTPGVARQFLGPKAPQYDKEVAEVVKKRLDVGEDPTRLFNETGYFKGIDGEIRKYEPNTTFIKKPGLVGKLFEDEAFLKGVGDRSFSIKSVLPPDDPMVKGYGKFLNKTKVKFEYDPTMPASSSGYITPYKDGSFEITVRSGNPHQAKVAIIHEMQHLVQNVEGYKGVGASEEMFKRGYPTAYDIAEPKGLVLLMKKFDLTWDEKAPATENLQFWLKEIKAGKTDVPEKLIPVVEEQIKKEMKHLTQVYRARHPMRRYETNAGEVEARIAEDWAAAPTHPGVPFDDVSIAMSKRNYPVLDPNRTITRDDIHFDRYDLGKNLDEMEGFGSIIDRVPEGFLKGK